MQFLYYLVFTVLTILSLFGGKKGETANDWKVPEPPREEVIGSYPETGSSIPTDPIVESTQDVNFSDRVFNVRIGNRYGSAVAIDSDTLLSASHILPTNRALQCEVLKDGLWLPGTITPIPGKDQAIVKVQGLNATQAEFAAPKVGDTVYVHGMYSATTQKGTYIGDNGGHFVKIDSAYQGVQQGDSGGGVFTEDGKVIGTIVGHVTERGRSHETEIAMYGTYAVKTPQQYSTATTPPSTPINVQTPNCQNGVCYPMQQYQIFRGRNGRVQYQVK